MDEKDWHILTTLFEEKNITKAAQRLYISQPALTYRIQQLEKEFKTRIVSRGKKGVDFTIQGEYLVQYSKEMLLQFRNAQEFILNMDKTIKGTLRLGVSGMFARYELPVILRDFLEQYPQVDINLKTGWSSEVNQRLQNEEAHIGIVRGNYYWKGGKKLIKQEAICLASRNKIDINQLPRLPRINYQTDSSLKDLIENWWQETYEFPPSISMEVDRIETCKQLVLNGLGYAILPGICLTEDDPLYKIPLFTKGKKPLLRETWMIYHESALQLIHVKAFIDFLLEYKTLV